MIELLREIREGIGISIRKLAQISGISKTYLIDIEKHPGKCNPTFDMMFNLEESLNIEPGTVYLYFVHCRKNNINNFLD